MAEQVLPHLRDTRAANLLRTAWMFFRRCVLLTLKGIVYALLFVTATLMGMMLLMWMVHVLVDWLLPILAAYFAVNFVLRACGRNGIWDSQWGHPVLSKRAFQKKSSRRSNL